MNATPPDTNFARWRLVKNTFAWQFILIAAVLWPLAIALPYKLAMPQGNLFTGMLQLFGVFVVGVAVVFWLVLFAISLYRRFWRFAGALLLAFVVFFIVGGVVGYRL